MSLDRASEFRIAVVTPTFPGRARMLGRAVASVAAQDLPAVAHVIANDVDGEGAGPTRQRGIDAVLTGGEPWGSQGSEPMAGWVAFLDDDDELMPHHLSTLAKAASETGADVVWPWFQVVGGGDPFPQHEGRQWDSADPHSFPITALVNVETLLEVGTRFGRGIVDGPMAGEDLPFWTDLLSSPGVVGHHVPVRTWLWHHHGANTSGQPHRRPGAGELSN